MATDKEIEAAAIALYEEHRECNTAFDELSTHRKAGWRNDARAAVAAAVQARAGLPNDTISRVTQEITAILSEPQNRERIARRIESAEPTTVSD